MSRFQKPNYKKFWLKIQLKCSRRFRNLYKFILKMLIQNKLSISIRLDPLKSFLLIKKSIGQILETILKSKGQIQMVLVELQSFQMLKNQLGQQLMNTPILFSGLTFGEALLKQVIEMEIIEKFWSETQSMLIQLHFLEMEFIGLTFQIRVKNCIQLFF